MHQLTLAKLHLHAVLPALEDLVELVPQARATALGWKFSLRLRLDGETLATLVSPGDGTLRVSPASVQPARLTLQFFSATQVNRTFLNLATFPPLPTAGFWNVGGVGPFKSLAAQLDAALQPKPGQLEDDSAYRERHVKLLFRVLLGAIPVLAMHDPHVGRTLAHTPDGTAEIRGPSHGLVGWVRWARGRMTGGVGPAPGEPDVTITFTDRATTEAALLGTLDPNAAVGLGGVDVRGLVPLADGLSVAMDRVEYYLQPVGSSMLPGDLPTVATA